VIVYCESGWRAALSMPALHVLGFDNVRGFTGSHQAWTEAGEPVTTG
jgi:3-mercaptopyruvate sulfurtransferase SseA